MEIKDGARSQQCPYQVASGAVHHSFGAASGARSVEHEEVILRVHLLQRAVRPHASRLLFEPVVATRLHGNVPLSALQHKAGPDKGASLQRFVADLLQRNHLAPAQPLVCSDDEQAVRVEHAAAQGSSREAHEDDAVHAANARRGQHREGGLGDHGHVDADAIALARAVKLVQVSHSAGLLLELLEADPPHFCRIVALVDDGRPRRGGLGPAVDAVVARVQPTSHKPAHVTCVEVVGDHLPEWPRPAQGLRLLRPEAEPL
mmetsp:Transcript_35018/g.81249  ORF Transcript_35018/g.81249 Transcript_35018/m.81249 type:complete len:260 (-) Transcript_35018:123-902(-)